MADTENVHTLAGRHDQEAFTVLATPARKGHSTDLKTGQPTISGLQSGAALLLATTTSGLLP